MDLGLTGKLVLVTGSTMGIGNAVAQRLVEAGANVIVNGRSQESVITAVEKLRALNPKTQVYGAVCDFSSPEGVEKLLQIVDKEIGQPLDVLVNNIGIFEAKPFEQITDEEWMHYFNVNVLTCVRLSRVFLPRMLARNSGTIIFISSEAGFCPKPFMIHYSLTKTAQLSLSRGLAELTKGTKVRVNTVMPGPTWTEGVATYIQGLAKEKNQEVEETKVNYFKEVEPTSLLQRFIKPEEVSDVVVFLASEASAAINGSSVRCEGGIIRMI